MTPSAALHTLAILGASGQAETLTSEMNRNSDDMMRSSGWCGISGQRIRNRAFGQGILRTSRTRHPGHAAHRKWKPRE